MKVDFSKDPPGEREGWTIKLKVKNVAYIIQPNTTEINVFHQKHFTSSAAVNKLLFLVINYGAGKSIEVKKTREVGIYKLFRN